MICFGRIQLPPGTVLEHKDNRYVRAASVLGAILRNALHASIVARSLMLPGAANAEVILTDLGIDAEDGTSRGPPIGGA